MQPVPPPSPWAARLRATASDVDAVARELRAAGRDVGLRGPAGAALQHLVDDVAADVQGLSEACERAADAEPADDEPRP